MAFNFFDLLQAAALALCIASALMIGAIHLSLDKETRQRLETGLLLLAFALFLFSLRLIGHFRADLIGEPQQLLFGMAAALFFLAGAAWLLGRSRTERLEAV